MPRKINKEKIVEEIVNKETQQKKTKLSGLTLTKLLELKSASYSLLVDIDKEVSVANYNVDNIYIQNKVSKRRKIESLMVNLNSEIENRLFDFIEDENK